MSQHASCLVGVIREPTDNPWDSSMCVFDIAEVIRKKYLFLHEVQFIYTV